MGAYLQLTEDQIALALAKGESREKAHMRRRSGRRDIAQQRTVAPDRVGIKGEGGAAMYLGSWDEWLKGAGARGDFKQDQGDVVHPGVQIRSTHHPMGGLLVREKAADLLHLPHRFLLVRVLPERWFDIVGWRYGYNCMVSEFERKRLRGKGERCWIVPGHKLEPPESVLCGRWNGKRWTNGND
jgi:hypothetical protein